MGDGKGVEGGERGSMRGGEQHRVTTHIQTFMQQQYLINLHNHQPAQDRLALYSISPFVFPHLLRSAADVPHLQRRGGGRLPRAHGWSGAEQANEGAASR